MPDDPYRYFRPEAREILDRLSQGVLELEKGEPAADLTAGLLRLAHTLKGAARIVKQREIADLAHEIEDALAPLRERSAPQTLPRPQIDRVLGVLDEIGSRLSALTPKPAATPETAGSGMLDEPLRTIRAEITDLDLLLDGLSEVSVRAGAVRRSLGLVEQVRHLAALLSEQMVSPRARDVRAGNPAAGKLMALADELRTAMGSLENNLTGGVESLERALRQAKGLAQQLRLVPANMLFSSLRRTTRDVAQTQGKRVAFESIGGDVRLDAHVLATLQPALVQLVRNGVVHGIEKQDERMAAGKPPVGTVTVEVSRHGKRVCFRCSDDGGGVDLTAVSRMAEKKGLLPAGARNLDAEILLQLLLKGGLSTSGAVTQEAGRGIGLDVVREAATRLGGDVSVRTQPRSGTMVELVVPVSLSSLDALLMETAGLTAAIPIEAVRKTICVRSDELAHTARGLAIICDGQMIPFVPLSQALGASEATRNGRAWSGVVVDSGFGLVAVGVHRLLGIENLVVRPLPAIAASPIVAGAALDAVGTPQLVLDPEELVGAVLGCEGTEATPERPGNAPVLVIDDSLTTRMLEQSILESAGYDVDLAASAEEALEKVKRNRYALFLVDIEMPGMDGFSFVEGTRSDPALRDVPAILVTSRSSHEDRKRSEEVGARAFIAKSEFDQTELLHIIRGLVS